MFTILYSKGEMKHLVGAVFRDEEALVSHGDRWRGRSRVNFNNFASTSGINDISRRIMISFWLKLI